ncbi:MAG: helix-turn-helix domain-containing protein [Rhodococcus sp. (in: high G+C Gram-positive bacteria)]
MNVDVGIDGPELDITTVELVEYLKARSEEIGLMLARRYREEIVEYRSLPEGFIEQDVAVVARRNFEDVLSGLSPADPTFEVHLQSFRDSAVRRFQQGVPIHALLQAYRLWGHTVWEQVVDAPTTKSHPAAALVIAGRIMKHVDLVSTTVAQAYLQKASGMIHDRELVRRDLVEALVTGNASERVDNYAPLFKLDLVARYFVILLRHNAGVDGSAIALRTQLDQVDRYVTAAVPGHSIVCIRGDEIVAVCPVLGEFPEGQRPIMDGLAARAPGFTVGVGRTYDLLASATRSYVDAQDAILSAMATPVGQGRRRAYLFTDALLDHVVRSSQYNKDLSQEALDPLRRYDEAHRSELIPTLRAYIDSGFSLAQSAQNQRIQPNTVKYRLQRIHSLTGHDPLDPHDILLFGLALLCR